MKRNGAIIAAAIILSLALIHCGKNISRAINLTYSTNKASVSQSLLMSEADAAEYLGIGEKAFKRMLAEDSKLRQMTNVYPPYRFVPYISIDGEKFFNKSELEKWVEFRMHNY